MDNNHSLLFGLNFRKTTMKKLLAMVGLSFLLVGCFEQAKVEKSDKPAEKTETVAAEVKNTENQSDKISPELAENKSGNQADTNVEQATEPKNAQLNASEGASSVDETKNAESKLQAVSVEKKMADNAVKTDDKATENTNTVEEKSANESQTAISEVAEQKTITEDMKPVKSNIAATKNVINSVKKQKLEEKRKSTQWKKKEFDYNSEGLSPEEQRVGAQRVLSAAENTEMKWKCRHPFMSAQEVIDFRCETKPVTIK